MADFDANAYKLVDVSGISSLIGGGANTYPQRSEESRLINRAEDISYLLEACLRRATIVNPKEDFVSDVVKYNISPFPKINNLWYAGDMFERCREEPFTAQRMSRFDHVAYLRNQPHGFALKSDWLSLVPSSVTNYQNIDDLIAKFKSAALYDTTSPNYAYKYIIKSSDIQNLYERIGATSILFRPNGQSEISMVSPILTSSVVQRSDSYSKTYDYTFTDEGGLAVDEDTYTIPKWFHPSLLIHPTTTSSSKKVYIQYHNYGTSQASFREVDGTSTTYLSGNDRFVVLIYANGYDGLDFYHNEYRMIFPRQMGGSIVQLLYDNRLYNWLGYPQNPTAASFERLYRGRATGHSMTIEAWCIGRIYADPASVKKWMWPGIA